MHLSTVSTILIILLSPAALAVPAPKPAPEDNLAIRQPPTQTLGSCDPPNEPANQPSISFEPTPSLFILVINPEETASTASTNPIPTETSPIKVFRITSLINETNTSNDSTPDTTNKNANAPSKIVYRISNFKAYLSNAGTGGDSYVNFDFHDDRKDYRYDVGCAMHTYGDLLDGKYYPCGEDRRTWFTLSPWGIVIRYTWTGRSMAMTGVAPQPMNWHGGQGADADITVTENTGGKTFTRTTDWPFTVQTLLAGDVSPPTSP